MNKEKNSPFIQQVHVFELFKELSETELSSLEAILTKETFLKDQVIVKEGDTGDKLYLITKGDVEILKRTAFGDEYTCDYLPECQHLFFGEFSLLDNDVRSATVKAVTPVEALVLQRAAFLSFCEVNQCIGYKLMKVIALRLASRLRKANQDILTLFEALVEEIGTH